MLQFYVLPDITIFFKIWIIYNSSLSDTMTIIHLQYVSMHWGYRDPAIYDSRSCNSRFRTSGSHKGIAEQPIGGIFRHIMETTSASIFKVALKKHMIAWQLLKMETKFSQIDFTKHKLNSN